MKEEHVTVAMFHIWSDSQRDLLKVLTAALATTNKNIETTNKNIETTNHNITVINKNIANISSEIKESNALTRAELKESNTLTREEISTQKASFNQHVVEYHFFTKVANDKFINLEDQQMQTTKTLVSRKGLYDSALKIKVGVSFVVLALAAGALGAWGKEFVKWVLS